MEYTERLNAAFFISIVKCADCKTRKSMPAHFEVYDRVDVVLQYYDEGLRQIHELKAVKLMQDLDGDYHFLSLNHLKHNGRIWVPIKREDMIKFGFISS
jgi:hypothetical protein